jgi:glutaredoxin-related protein
MVIPLVAVQALADIYSWTDRNGVKHFSNDPPPKGEAVTDVIVMEESVVEEPADETAKSGEEPPRENAADSSARKIYIYVEPNSATCNQALAFFDKNRIPYNKIDITVSPAEAQRFKNVQGAGVPLIFFGERRMDGWDEETAREYLGMNTEPTVSEKAVRALDAAKVK